MLKAIKGLLETFEADYERNLVILHDEINRGDYHPGCGLPIGNFTSQIFANFYLNSFDHFVKHDLGVRFYGSYVDYLIDMAIFY